jgi:hypothetical protein
MALSELVEMPAANESWDSGLVVLFQSAKKLDIHKQKAFVDTVKGLLVGLEGL